MSTVQARDLWEHTMAAIFMTHEMNATQQLESFPFPGRPMSGDAVGSSHRHWQSSPGDDHRDSDGDSDSDNPNRPVLRQLVPRHRPHCLLARSR